VLRHAGRIRELAGEIHALLYEDDEAVLGRLDRAAERLDELEGLGMPVPETAAGLEAARACAEDLALEARGLADRAVTDPARLDGVEERLLSLEALKRKHGGSLDAVLEAAAGYRSELAELDRAGALLEEHTDRRERAAELWRTAAIELEAARTEAGDALSRRVRRELAALAMGEADLQVHVGSAQGEEGPAGVERISFLLAANPGEPARPLERVASGGELSRIMLALNTVLEAGLAPRTLVFDEVDAGIAAGVADRVGERLAGLARRHQVLCITHLPQIARRAGRHFRVDKTTRGGRTRATVVRLEEEGRLEEIARMLGGRRITETTRRHAAELLGRATAKGAEP
jgi:DNA repair protein RecN (Recombination protein N)